MNLKETINRIRNINLKEFAEKHYGAEFIGNKSKCILPTHKGDSNPSLVYYPNTNKLCCFGCHGINGGDIFDFVGVMEGYNTNGRGFMEIVKTICKKENIIFTTSTKKIDKEAIAILNARTEHTKRFMDNLWNDTNSYAFNYLLGRGLTDKTINEFCLGVTDKFEKQYPLSNISNRISIPILSKNGKKVIATSFRSLLGTDTGPKYKHDVSDKVFHKKSTFYGYAHAISHIIKAKKCYIVEGYFDMISMYQAGIKNVMASMGAFLTQEQIQILNTITDEVTIIIDQDKAGIKGISDRLQMLLRSGMQINIIDNLEYNGKDLNDVCNALAWNKVAIKELLDRNEKDVAKWKVCQILDKYDEKVFKLKREVLNDTETIVNSIVNNNEKAIIKSIIKKRIDL